MAKIHSRLHRSMLTSRTSQRRDSLRFFTSDIFQTDHAPSGVKIASPPLLVDGIYREAYFISYNSTCTWSKPFHTWRPSSSSFASDDPIVKRFVWRRPACLEFYFRLCCRRLVKPSRHLGVISVTFRIKLPSAITQGEDTRRNTTYPKFTLAKLKEEVLSCVS